MLEIMHANAALIDGLYGAFAARDWQAMGACYHPDATFSDPVFPALTGREVVGMWHMFCEQGTDLEVTWSDVEADADHGRARWEARYTFSPTGRPVVNRIRAEFDFRDGKIARHVDDFDFYAWSRMALGPMGAALGWTPLLRRRVQQQARAQLDRFMAADGWSS